MTDKEFFDRLKRIGPEYERLISRTLPVKIGAKGKAMFQDNFRKGGYQDGGLHAWKPAHRQFLGRGADSKRGPLLSSRKVLYNSIGYTPSRGSVTIFSNVIYAGIHNEGGTVNSHPTVTPKMRRYAWARYYESGGGKKGREDSSEAEMWKGLALTKKTRLNIRANIPKRQFMGSSKELKAAVTSIVETEVSKVLNL
jgi:phage gpG-like protein